MTARKIRDLTEEDEERLSRLSSEAVSLTEDIAKTRSRLTHQADQRRVVLQELQEMGMSRQGIADLLGISKSGVQQAMRL